MCANLGFLKKKKHSHLKIGIILLFAMSYQGGKMPGGDAKESKEAWGAPWTPCHRSTPGGTILASTWGT